jgi:hypothetical protein
MSNKHDHLNNCLERLLQGEELESCLKNYSEEAQELRILLTTAVGVKQYAETIKPRPEFISQTRDNLANAYESEYLSRKVRIIGVLKPVVRFAAITAVVIMLLVCTFTGTVTLSVLASENTMPGQTLYPVKLAMEQIRITFAFSDEVKVDYLTRFAETRAKEIAYASEKGDADQVEAALQGLERNLSRVEEIVTPGGVSSEVTTLQQEPQGLQKIEKTVKDSSAKAQGKLKDLKEPDTEKKVKITGRVDKAYTKAIEAIEAAKAHKANK